MWADGYLNSFLYVRIPTQGEYGGGDVTKG